MTLVSFAKRSVSDDMMSEGFASILIDFSWVDVCSFSVFLETFERGIWEV